ncbi:MAG: penicillin-binding protein 2 [Ignavibacteria bacterium GWF2_33_9]|nr:MAG: penicillin-binding protein 2 [Ignavibacteria bacterium GWF2_33_9]
MAIKIIQRRKDEESAFAQVGRAKFLKSLIFIIFFLFFFRIVQLQILAGSEYLAYSEAQAIKKLRVIPPRGQIFDANGILLVHNQASYNLNITPASFDSTSFKILSNLIKVDTTIIDQVFAVKNKFEKYAPILLQRDLDFGTLSLIEEYLQYLKGVSINIESKRLYEKGVRMPHILGYIRQVSDAQLKEHRYYQAGDLIGQYGLEKFYEDMMHGIEGYEIVAFDRKGERSTKFNEGLQDQAPIGGSNFYLSIDFNLQKYAEDLLGNKRGAIVGMNPQNGEIVFMVSKPDFSPDLFNGKLTQEDADYLFNNESHPMINRAIQGTYPPGSTWKMLMAIAALQEGIITPNTTFYCNGGFYFGGRDIKCHGSHGNVSLINAIKGSCNSYFAQLALKVGMTNFGKYGKMFNFGALTGIDLPNEKWGVLPDKAWLDTNYKERISYPGRLVNFGIGQGEILASPLQMAVYISTIANKGTVIQPHIVKYIQDMAKKKVEKVNYTKTKLPIDESIFNIISKAMYSVVNEAGGTATNTYIPGVKVCGKTGTAQNPRGKDHSWFVCYAPMDNPELVIAVIVENAGFGATVAAPIARNILMKYFKVSFPSSKTDSTETDTETTQQ